LGETRGTAGEGVSSKGGKARAPETFVKKHETRCGKKREGKRRRNGGAEGWQDPGKKPENLKENNPRLRRKKGKKRHATTGNTPSHKRAYTEASVQAKK